MNLFRKANYYYFENVYNIDNIIFDYIRTCRTFAGFLLVVTKYYYNDLQILPVRSGFEIRQVKSIKMEHEYIPFQKPVIQNRVLILISNCNFFQSYLTAVYSQTRGTEGGFRDYSTVVGDHVLKMK